MSEIPHCFKSVKEILILIISLFLPIDEMSHNYKVQAITYFPKLKIHQIL